ncbi:serine/threonine-protein kinase [Marinicella meishanensis]|uniref:serine/threonine-protein kinase n=1 Tax=Marinicella meishanensis TaxID=2873263 RepID=UPI001CBB1F6E|nr:serine/threonine-protein kinase [Marinicella sp. NBU2979]
MPDIPSIETLVTAATQLPASERAAYIQEHTQHDPDLAAQVTALLQPDQLSATDSMVPLDFSLGDAIGPYRIKQELGHGGMGTVFLVEQTQPIQRQVALKVVRLGMDTQEVLSRFEQERQALAMMSHPHVAAVYDAGATDQGRPYFVMEYVTGETITAYANRHQLTIEQRIELVIQACQGVLHAHQKGILHRDLKPGNILVTENDGLPQVKIIDFGVAKSIAQKLTEKTVKTQLGAFIGTPYYMSPEQALATPGGVDTRTDVYSLGVVLYELLVGSLPFDLQTFNNKTPQQVQEIIRHHIAPTPLHKLKSNAYNQQSIAAQRHSSVHEIKRILKSDLSSIVMQAIAKDPEQRYGSTSALETDLRRYLNGLPVEAQAPTTAYKLKKLLWRHKLLASAVLAVMLALTIGLLVSLRALQHAERESVHAAAVSTMLSDILLNADPENIDYRDQITLKQVIMGLEEKLDAQELLRGSAFNRARELGLENSLQWTLYEHLADVHHSVGNFTAAEKNYHQAISLRNQTKRPTPLPLAVLNLKLSKTLVELGQLEQAQSHFDLAMQAVDPPHNEAQAIILLQADGVFRSKGEINASIAFERRLLTIAERFFGHQSEAYAWQLVELASNLIQTGDQASLDEALARVHAAKRLAQQLDNPNLRIEFNARRFIIFILNGSDRSAAIEEALDLVNWCSETFGHDHLKTLDAGTLLTYVLLWDGQYQAALDRANSYLPILTQRVSADHHLLRTIQKYKGNALVFLNRYAEAIPLLQQELQLAQQAESQPEIAYAAEAIGQSFYHVGQLAEAQRHLELALDNVSHVLNQSIMQAELAQIQLMQGNLDQAFNQAQEALKANANNVLAHLVLAHVAHHNGQSDRAIDHLYSALPLQASQSGEHSLQYAAVQAELMWMYLQLGQASKALQLLDGVIAPEQNTALAVHVRLIMMAVQVQNGAAPEPELSSQWLNELRPFWSSRTRQFKMAESAATMAGLKFSQ